MDKGFNFGPNDFNCRKMILGHMLPSAPMHCLGFRWARKAKQMVCWWSEPASPAQELSQLARLCSIFLEDPATMGLCPRSLLVIKTNSRTGKFFRWSDLTILKPGWRHLSWESWILAQKGKWTRIWKDFFSGGCWKGFGQEWTGLSAVGTVNLLRCTRTPRSDGEESKWYLELNQKNSTNKRCCWLWEIRLPGTWASPISPPPLQGTF